MTGSQPRSARTKTLLCHFLSDTLRCYLLLVFSLSTAMAANTPEDTIEQYALAMHGKPKYPADFSHFDYVRPDAPKGGTLKLGSIGTFDSFNPFIPKGVPADGLSDFLYQTLTVQSQDEPFTTYGLIARAMTVPKDRSYVIFHLRPQARFSDGSPITPSDVIFTYNMLLEKGSPSYQFYYSAVDSVTSPAPDQVKFSFKGGDHQELPLILGQLPVLSEKYWAKRDFSQTTLDIPPSNGPYVLESYDTGRRITYKRDPNYWGKDLPVNKGRFNFDSIVFEYFMEPSIAVEAFKSGTYHFRSENNSKVWATQYQGEAFDSGKIQTRQITHEEPAGMQGFIFNIRNPLFQDITLRKAMSYAFDFEWSNKNLFYGQYKRTRSFFQNTELAATGLPSEAELAVLEPIKERVPKAVFTSIYEPVKTTGNGKNREQLRQGIELLKSAGYTIKDNQLYTPKGVPVRFEFMLIQNAGFERIVLPFKKNLSVMGIDVSVRNVDVTQYTERLRKFDFDMVVATLPQSLSPGNEQRNMWTSAAADQPNSRNLIGLKDPAVDYLVEGIVNAQSREDLVVHARALDRVLQWQFLVIPNWHINAYRIAYWNHLDYPQTTPRYGFDIMSWWQKPEGTAAQ